MLPDTAPKYSTGPGDEQVSGAQLFGYAIAVGGFANYLKHKQTTTERRYTADAKAD